MHLVQVLPEVFIYELHKLATAQTCAAKFFFPCQQAQHKQSEVWQAHKQMSLSRCLDIHLDEVRVVRSREVSAVRLLAKITQPQLVFRIYSLVI